MAKLPALSDVFLSGMGLNDVSTTLGLTSLGGHVMASSPGHPIAPGDASHCADNCSGHGTCQDGHCICLVQFSGGTCREVNMGYYIAFGTIFLLLGLVALVQLVLCVRYEYLKDAKRSWRRACQVTVQKLLYVLVICATAIRGAYFFTKLQVSDDVASRLWSAYFPVIITGFSLIVCFWAEAFHLSSADPEGSERERRQFLSKSTLFFIVFNVLQYLLLVAQLIVVDTIDNPHARALVSRVCNGGFAFLMIVSVVFFLIYGVEVYFKVRGAFRESESGFDTWQLHMSRLGLVAQAALQLVTALFLVADVTSDSWRDKLPVLSLNFYDIGFRVVEFGVALWFPCVLWNCGRPEELWVLNPKRIFRSFQLHRRQQERGERGEGGEDEGERDGEASPIHTIGTGSPRSYKSFLSTESGSGPDCWICYDVDRRDAGPLIQPCACKGDVATVHHDCLKRWLLESVANDSIPECRVCGERYKLETGYWLPLSLRPGHWLQTFVAMILVVGTPFAAYAICHSLSQPATYVQLLAIGTAVLVEIIALRMFVVNCRSSCKRARVATMRISGKEVILDSTKVKARITDRRVKAEATSMTANSERTVHKTADGPKTQEPQSPSMGYHSDSERPTRDVNSSRSVVVNSVQGFHSGISAEHFEEQTGVFPG